MTFQTVPIRIASSITRPARRRPAAQICSSQCPHRQRASRRLISTASEPPQSATVDTTSTPRWQYTPPATKAPVRLRGPDYDPDSLVNTDPQKLDNFYVRMLGNGGDKMLSEEVKWQAVTHKSFDQGRRGFNERLGYLGKQIVLLQASLALVENGTVTPEPDSHGRKPFDHPALHGVGTLATSTRQDLLRPAAVATLATEYGLPDVIRWFPRNPENLPESGIARVLTLTTWAVVGAVSLEKGGMVANKIARDRILAPLGFPMTPQSSQKGGTSQKKPSI